jgi:hypothetical protein
MGMICCAEMQLGPLELQQFFPKVASEIWIIVEDNTMRHAMEFEYIIHENLSHSRCFEWVLEGYKNEHIWKCD